MNKNWRLALHWIVTIILVVGASYGFAVYLSAEKEEHPELKEFHIDDEMTIEQLGHVNDLPADFLKKFFSVSNDQLQTRIRELEIPLKEVKTTIRNSYVLYLENQSKNWIKIVVKFALWFIALGIAFYFLKKQKMNPGNRKWFFLGSVVIFGVILGADPSPMGTVKDALVLYGSEQVIFLPRIIAFAVFILMVVLLNKAICTWGCQFGTLQDFLFRLNRDKKDKKTIIRPVKIPFIITNTIRILFFVTLILVAFLHSFDITEEIDPFKIFKPQVLGIFGAAFIGILLLLSLFVYRPWCFIFCPFGLVGWVFEKVSLFKINVNYDTCIACEACSKACPTFTMDAILKREKIIPDCFICGTCINSCPTNSIHLQAKKRTIPDKNKFKKKELSK